MPSSSRLLGTAIAAAVFATACTDVLTDSENTLELSPAFQTIPVGFSANSNSFEPTGDIGLPFVPESMVDIGFHGGNSGRGGDNSGPGSSGDKDRRDGDDHDRKDGFGGRGIRGLLMGGGISGEFIGAIAFGKGKGRGPFGMFSLPDRCTFSETTGRVTCPPKDRHGLTVKVSFAFKDEAGNAQPKFDTLTTDFVNVQTDVSGTKSRHGGDDANSMSRDDDGDDNKGNHSVTSTLSHKSDLSASGLAPGSTERTIDGTAEAHEKTTGKREEIEFTAEREAFDTITNVVIPIVEGRPTIPKAGTIIRRMLVTITKTGKEPRTKFRREEITFDGSNVIKVKITQDDVTKDCTLTLPGKKLVCQD